jgi:hypothetical protein
MEIICLFYGNNLPVLWKILIKIACGFLIFFWVKLAFYYKFYNKKISRQINSQNLGNHREQAIYEKIIGDPNS